MDSHKLGVEKDLKIYELELHVKDLKEENKELSQTQEKLRIANQNARVLEEENTNLLKKIRTTELGEIDPSFFPSGVEAAKLIRENSDLRHELNYAKQLAKGEQDKATLHEGSLEKQIREAKEKNDKVSKEYDRLVKELENSRRQCIDLKHQLEGEQETANAASELWEKERARYSQKMEELLTNSKRPDNNRTSRVVPSPGTKSEEIPLQQLLLKEEVEQLEDKLKKIQEQHWEKEKVWLQTESELKEQIVHSQNGTNGTMSFDKEVYRSLQDQVLLLKDEITTLRRSQRPGRTVPMMNFDDDKESVFNDNYSRPPEATRNNTDHLTKKLNELRLENNTLREQLDNARSDLFATQAVVEDKNIRQKELEVALATANTKARQGGQPTNAIGKSVPEPEVARGKNSSSADDAALQKKNRDLQNELQNLRAAQEQKEAINAIRVKEYQSQIDELLVENENIRHNPGSNKKNAESSQSSPEHQSSISRLMKDKRDSVEDVMRLLEAAWTGEMDAQQDARHARYQGAAMANHDAMKDEEIRHLQQQLDDLERRLRDSDADKDSLDKKRHDLARENERLADELRELKKRERENGKHKDADNRNLDNENQLLRKKLNDLEQALADKEAARKADANKQDQLQRQLEGLRNDNDRLRRDAARSPRRDLSANRSPRVSARRRTPEYTPLSQLSVRSSDDRKRSAIPDGAHLSVTIVELADVLRNGRPITEPGYVIIKLKSIKEKYKTSVKELASVIRFDESFEFYLAQPDQDVITLHIFYKPKSSSREYHIGDACFSMATLYRGICRQRIAPVAQNPGSKEARRSGQVEVLLQTDDFGKMVVPSDAEVEDENLRFTELANKLQSSSPERLHAVDVYMASAELQ